MWSLSFWKDATERFLKTFLQTFFAVVAVDSVFDVNALKVGAVAAAFSAASSIVSTFSGSKTSASLVK